jgi:hypothetical protein
MERCWKNAVLTGVPRSGTTLSCYLLNSAPNTIALHEPMNIQDFLKLRSRPEQIHFIQNSFYEYRVNILNKLEAPSLQIHGEFITDSFPAFKKNRKYRSNKAHLGLVKISKKIDQDFALIVKHPSIFTGLLPDLSKVYKCVAVIRNPLAILSSWNSINTYHQTGRSPSAEAVDPELRIILMESEDVISRQIKLLNWYFNIYLGMGQKIIILKYEETISTRGKVLFSAFDIPQPNECGNIEFENRNQNKFLDGQKLSRCFDTLMEYNGSYFNYYSPQEIVDLYTQMLISV